MPTPAGVSQPPLRLLLGETGRTAAARAAAPPATQPVQQCAEPRVVILLPGFGTSPLPHAPYGEPAGTRGPHGQALGAGLQPRADAGKHRAIARTGCAMCTLRHGQQVYAGRVEPGRDFRARNGQAAPGMVAKVVTMGTPFSHTPYVEQCLAGVSAGHRPFGGCSRRWPLCMAAKAAGGNRGAVEPARWRGRRRAAPAACRASATGRSRLRCIAHGFCRCSRSDPRACWPSCNRLAVTLLRIGAWRECWPGTSCMLHCNKRMRMNRAGLPLFDEMHAPDGTVRAAYRDYQHWLTQQDSALDAAQGRPRRRASSAAPASPSTSMAG